LFEGSCRQRAFDIFDVRGLRAFFVEGDRGDVDSNALDARDVRERRAPVTFRGVEEVRALLRVDAREPAGERTVSSSSYLDDDGKLTTTGDDVELERPYPNVSRDERKSTREKELGDRVLGALPALATRVAPRPVTAR
jgi:hypothetical protein